MRVGGGTESGVLLLRGRTTRRDIYIDGFDGVDRRVLDGHGTARTGQGRMGIVEALRGGVACVSLFLLFQLIIARNCIIYPQPYSLFRDGLKSTHVASCILLLFFLPSLLCLSLRCEDGWTDSGI